MASKSFILQIKVFEKVIFITVMMFLTTFGLFQSPEPPGKIKTGESTAGTVVQQVKLLVGVFMPHVSRQLQVLATTLVRSLLMHPGSSRSWPKHLILGHLKRLLGSWHEPSIFGMN